MLLPGTVGGYCAAFGSLATATTTWGRLFCDDRGRVVGGVCSDTLSPSSFGAYFSTLRRLERFFNCG